MKQLKEELGVVLIAGALAAAILASCSSGAPDYDVTATAEIRRAELTVASEQRNATATREREIVKATADVVTATASAKRAEATANAAPLATSRAATRVAATATAAPQATARAEARAAERAAAAAKANATPTEAEYAAFTRRTNETNYWFTSQVEPMRQCVLRGDIDWDDYGWKLDNIINDYDSIAYDLSYGRADMWTKAKINDAISFAEDLIRELNRRCDLR